MNFRIRKIVLGLLVFISGLFIKVLMWSQSPYISRDSVYYLNKISTWFTTGRLISDNSMIEGPIHPPFFLFLVKSIMSVGISALDAGLLLNMVLGSLIPIIIYSIAYRISHKQIIAIACMFIALLHPSLNHLSVEIQRDIGYLFFSCLLVLFIIRGIQQKCQLYNWSMAGVLLSCTIMFRVESLEFIPLTVLLLLFLLFNKKITLIKLGVDLSFFIGSAFISFIVLLHSMGLHFLDLKTIYMSYYSFAERVLW